MPPAIDWLSVLLAVWALGALAALCWLAVHNLRFQRRIRRARPLSGGAPLPMYLVPGLPSPCLYGVLRPRILLNEAAIRTPEVLHMVLTHELTHWRRRDHLFTWMRAVVCCLWWWDPLVWAAARLSREDQEAACDEAVTAAMDAQQRRAYGLSLIELMRDDVPRTRPVMGTAMRAGKREMQQRILAIKTDRHRNRTAALCCLLCVALLVPLVMTSAEQPTPVPQAQTLETAAPPSDDAEVIALAEQAVRQHVVFDYGIDRFTGAQVSEDTVQIDGRIYDTFQVAVTAVSPQMRQRVTVHLDRLTGAPITIQGAEGIYWMNDQMTLVSQERVDQQGYILTPRAGERSVSMGNAPDDYGWAKELLYNGTPVTIDWYAPTRGHYSHELFNDPKEEWAHITVGKTALFAGASGYVPRVTLTLEQPAGEDAAPLYATVQGEGPVALLADAGSSQAQEAQLKPGARVRLLGRSRSYYHVEAQGKTGYLPLAALQFDQAVSAVLAANQPAEFLDVEPGWEQKDADFQREFSLLRNRWGDTNTWDLEQLVKMSGLSEQYGIAWTWDRENRPLVYVMPGPDDLTEEQAAERAYNFASKEWGVRQEDIARQWVTYSHPQGAPDAKTWSVRYSMLPPGRDCRVWLDQSGEVINSWQSDMPNMQEQFHISAPTDSVDYYLNIGISAQPQEGDMAEAAAKAKAMEIFAQAYPQGKGQTYTQQAAFKMDPDGADRWWQVDITGTEDLPYQPSFFVVILASGEEVYHSEDYARYMEDARQNARAALEEERSGPFITWPLEKQAQWTPDNYGLPGKEHISQRQAEQTARDYLEKIIPLAKEEVDGMTANFSFMKAGQWMVYLTPKGVTPESNLNIYTVLIDAVTGEVVSHIDPADPHTNG